MENINEHDMTKKMIDTMRVINENTGVEQNDGQDDVIELSGDERSSEEQKFREIIDSSTQFNVFNVYPEANNVVFGGVIQGMGGIEFQMTLEDSNGLYITGNNVQITDEVADKIKKLKGFYDNWKSDWFQKLATEYKGGQQM